MNDEDPVPIAFFKGKPVAWLYSNMWVKHAEWYWNYVPQPGLESKAVPSDCETHSG